jgi:hypothetical protein
MGQADEPCLSSGLLSRKPQRKFSLDPGAVAFDRGMARKRLANLTIPTRGARHRGTAFRRLPMPPLNAKASQLA